MSVQVLVNQPVEAKYFAQLEAMEEVTVRMAPDPKWDGPLELPEEILEESEILFSTFLPKGHEAMGKLKLIQIGSAGYSQLLGAGLSERGIRVCNGSGILDTAIAEWNLAMMSNLIRDVRQMIRLQEKCRWERRDKFQSSLRERTAGFWGYGGLARETARLCKAAGMKVHVLTRDGMKPRLAHYTVPGTGDPEGVIPEKVFTAGETKAFLNSLDFLVMALPLNTETQGIVGLAELKQLRRGAYLLNPARGPLIQEAALLGALREGWIAGAALDVHYYYPMPPEHPLWTFDNVIMTPHISGSSEGEYYLPRLWDLFIENVRRFLQGRSLLNELSAEVL